MLSGGNGCIGGLSNLVPEVCHAWVDAFRREDLAAARKVQMKINGLMEIYLDSIQKATYSPDLNQANHEGEEGTDFVLDYIYQHFTDFKLIFCCSTGSQYEHFLDRLGEIEESYYQELVEKYGKAGYTVDRFFIHVFCRAGWQTMYELVAHDRSYKEAQSFMNSTKLFNVAGWKAVMGINE